MKNTVFVARFGLLCVPFLFAAPAMAQAVQGPTPPVTLPSSTDPAAQLSENLKALARDPYNVDALIQAGFGALAVGDPNAAFGFFARAEELSPSNWRAKAGLGSSLTMMEKSADALRLFTEAAQLGAPDVDIAADRGLAYDLEGDSKRAQRDYLAALKARPSDEVTRRLALSLGIAGDRDTALTRLDPLLVQNDQGAWRARAFILAMNGDLPGAERIVRVVAPGDMATQMTGFLQRLSALNPSARAHAVHFGTLPASSQTVQMASLDEEGFRPLDPAAAAKLKAPEPDRRTSAPIGADARPDVRDARRQAREERDLARLADRGRRAAINPVPKPALESVSRVDSGAVQGAAQLPPSTASEQTVTRNPAQGARPITQDLSPVFEVPPATARPSDPPQLPSRQAVASAPVQAATLPQSDTPKMDIAAPTAAVAMAPNTPMSSESRPEQGTAPVPLEAENAGPTPRLGTEAQPTTPPTTVPVFSLAAVVRTLELEPESQPVALPDEAKMRALRIAAQRKAAAEEKARQEKLEQERKAAEEAAKARRNPARIWVQIATGNNTQGLPGTWRSLKSRAPKSLGDQKPWFVPFRQTNRLLVGPVRSSAEARNLVNDLAKEGIQATVFSSEAGQEIDRVNSK